MSSGKLRDFELKLTAVGSSFHNICRVAFLMGFSRHLQNFEDFGKVHTWVKFVLNKTLPHRKALTQITSFDLLNLKICLQFCAVEDPNKKN